VILPVVAVGLAAAALVYSFRKQECAAPSRQLPTTGDGAPAVENTNQASAGRTLIPSSVANQGGLSADRGSVDADRICTENWVYAFYPRAFPLPLALAKAYQAGLVFPQCAMRYVAANLSSS